MDFYKGVLAWHARSREEWRQWLLDNHLAQQSVWLIIYKKSSNIPTVYYPEAVDEALCFGWVDSKPNKRDDESYYQYFSRRNPASNWSKVNKDKVKALMVEGLIQPAGLEMIETAKRNGTWTALDDVENIVLPKEMVALLKENKEAKAHWENFPRSTKRGILEWIMNAKHPETCTKRIRETVSLAAQNIRANQYKPPPGENQAKG